MRPSFQRLIPRASRSVSAVVRPQRAVAAAAAVRSVSRAVAARPSVTRVRSVRQVNPVRTAVHIGARLGVSRQQARWMSSQGSFADSKKKPDMFCFQCEQTRDGIGCQTVGVCGKTPQVAALQDLLVQMVKGIAMYTRRARELGKSDADIDRFVLGALFVTVTNVNFDEAAMFEWLQNANAMKNSAKELYTSAGGKDTLGGAAALDLSNKSLEELVSMGEMEGIYERRKTLDADYVGLQEMAMYGLKGAAAYMSHATSLGMNSDSVHAAISEVLDDLTKTDSTVPELLALSMKVGATNYDVMGLLDQGHTSHFDHPVPTPVSTVPKAGKAILVSGHDLIDLERVLEQTEGTGINVYTHGEMLPAHSYPKLKKHKHLAGHWGGPWQLQKFDFHEFPGSILMTSNCIVEPRKSYKSRIFTRNAVGFPGVTHIRDNDYSGLIKAAQEADGFDADDVADLEAGTKVKSVMTGFGHNAVMSVAPTVIEAVKSGAISHFFLVGGCDGSEGERSYYTELAQQAPKDTVFLTLGCGKYRINKLPMGDIGGIPRVLDMGQCNDSYSAIQVALALADAFKTDVNGLPLNLVLSWFEQKAVAVLLTLLHLGVKNIRIGPKLPGFATPAMLNVLVSEFGVTPIDDAGKDLKIMLNKQ